MQSAIVFLAIVATVFGGPASPYVAYSAPGTILTRAPAFDSAVIKSDRLGGNFAYSVAESHAYAAHTPIVQQVTSPVAVSYSAPAVTYAAAAPAVTYAAAAPAIAAAPVAAYSAYNAAPIAYNAAPIAYNAAPIAYNAAYNAYPYGYSSAYYLKK